MTSAAPTPVTSAAPADDVLLTCRGLRVGIPHESGLLWPVRGVDLEVRPGSRVGLIGESGSGKTLTALSTMGLVGIPGARVEGSIRLGDQELLGGDDRAWSRVRGRQIAMVYQNPLSALNPIRTVGHQIVECIRAHEPVSKAVARQRAVDLLGEVGIVHPDRRFGSYPFELSGGMRQRVVIAMALSANPQLLVADEPTTALDVTTQARILQLLDRVIEERRMALLLITHDIQLALSMCTDVSVMYAGRIVERQPAHSFRHHPVHPYSDALLSSVVTLTTPVGSPMASIGGQPPSPAVLPAGCAFEPRCPARVDTCRTAVPPGHHLGGEVFAECHLAEHRAQPSADGAPS